MKTTILRIYMPLAAKMKNPKSFWQRVFGASLNFHLTKRAKEFGIKQTITQRIQAGYLEGQKLVFDQVEVAPPSLPICVELIDDETKLREYVRSLQSDLKECRVVLFQGAEVLMTPTQEGN